MESNFTDELKQIESKWQKRWETAQLFTSDPQIGTERYFGNIPFPYVNGTLHLGHGYSLLKLEAMVRYQRMLGKNVLWPYAFHATGEPIQGMAKRIRESDKTQIDALLKSEVPQEIIETFTDPKKIVTYFINSMENTLRSLGTAIDWRRKFVTTPLYPVFSAFIEWHYRKLIQKGYVVKGTHAVIYCPSCNSPTGDHDRLEGEGVRIIDFITLKFYSEKFQAHFLAGTLRPETIFGVTNVFVHPDESYVIIKTKTNEKFLVAEKSAIKFEDQEFASEVVRSFSGSELIGSYLVNPVTQEQLLILPGTFIDINVATGVVMSVPAHAPFDWIVLQEQKRNETLQSVYKIEAEIIRRIEPIAVIQVEGFNKFPACDVINENKINSSKDSKLKEVTKLLYRKELNSGITLPIAGKYGKMPVKVVRERLTKELLTDKRAIILKDPVEPVICRCKTRNHVKILLEQWFLKFGDKEWKKSVHKMLEKIEIHPEAARKAFQGAIDWLEDKACVRRSGLGTPAPWDDSWIIETLSDSVIYMAFYCISKYVNSEEFKEEWAVDEIFDYVLLNIGNPAKLEKASKVPSNLLQKIRAEVEYWYGFDIRTSGKDLINNHLSYMLFHHVAIFPEKYWPKALHVNGHVNLQTQLKSGKTVVEKMSKSKGNFIPLDKKISEFGADVVRIAELSAGEGLEDATIALFELDTISKWLQNFREMHLLKVEDVDYKQIDRWLISKMQEQTKKVRYHLEKFETRSAFQVGYHEPLQLLRQYLNRRGAPGPAYHYTLVLVLKYITPFSPHLCEEIWELLGNTRFITTEQFPEPDLKKVNLDAEHMEFFLEEILADLKKLLNFLVKVKGNKKPSEIELYIAPDWKYEIYMEARNGLSSLLKNIMKNQKFRKKGKQAVNYANQLRKLGKPPNIPWSRKLELRTLLENREYFAKTFDAKFKIISDVQSKHPKAMLAIPRRPGINLLPQIS